MNHASPALGIPLMGPDPRVSCIVTRGKTLVLSSRGCLGILWLASLMVMPLTAAAHEYWIEPVQFQVNAGGHIVANLKVGQNFKGNVYPYIPGQSKGAWIVDADGKRLSSARVGDIPAFKETPGPPGLHILAYYSMPYRLTYTEPGKFAHFLEAAGLEWALVEHRQRGLPEIGFVEVFSRCAKALVQNGIGGGDDEVIGMPIELVANENPYDLSPTASALAVTLLWQGAPLANAQITVFRDKGGLDVTKVRTGPDGVALAPLGGGGKFLLNAVHIIPWDEQPKDEWHSYWASLTFEISAEP